MTTLRPALALLGKELGHHGLGVLVAAVLVAASLAIQWFVSLEEGAPTLMSAATGVAYYGLPLVAIWINERLVVADRVARTHEFLAALPVAPWLRDALRAALGAAVLVGLSTAALVVTALVASRREGVPLLWWLQLWLQTTSVVIGWHGVAFGVAHLGRWRWLVWWGWAMLGSTLEAWMESPWRDLWWTAPLADTIDQTRSLPPWDAIPLALAWAVTGYAVGLGLASWRAGALPARWFEPPTSVQRATVVGAGTLMAVLSTQAMDLVPPDDRWRTLPAVTGTGDAVVRVAGGEDTVLYEVGVEAGAVLDQIGARVGIASWPPLVLLRSRSEEGRAVRVAVGEREDVSHVLLVDPEVSEAVLVRDVVTEALLARATDAARRDDDAWPLYGAAAWLRPDLTVQIRAGRARGRFVPGTGWPGMVALLGPTVAEGAAWAGLEAIEAEAGEEAVWETLRALLGPRRSNRWPGTARLWWTTRFDAVPRWTGIAAPDLKHAWVQTLALQEAPPAPPLPRLTLEARDGEVLASWDGPAPEGTVLRWVVVDPLERTVRPDSEVEEVTLQRGERVRPLPVDPRAKVRGELAVFDPALQGRATTGWEARR